MTGLREWINSRLSAGKGGQPGGNRASIEISPQRAPEDPVHLGYAERIAEVESAAREVRDRERSTAYGARLKPHPSVAVTGHIAVMSPRQIREAHAARMASDEEFEERYRDRGVDNYVATGAALAFDWGAAGSADSAVQAVQFEGFSGGEGGGGGASFDMSAAGDGSADSSSADSSSSGDSSDSSDSSSSSSDSSDSSNSGGGDL